MPEQHGPTNPQSIDVPYEIWTSIASYLSWVEVQSLFSLNRFFLGQYLRTKYGTVHIGEILNPQAFLSLKRLKEPSLGLYVQDLTLRPAALTRLPLKIPLSYLEPISQSKIPLPTKKNKKKLKPGLAMSNSNQEITDKDLIKIVSNLTGVTTLTVECAEDELRKSGWYTHFPDLLRSGWTAFKSTLETLVLKFPMGVDSIISAFESPRGSRWAFPSEPLPRLERVVLHISCSRPPFSLRQSSYGINVFDSTLLAFLNTNNHIKHLDLGVFGGGNLDSSMLLNRIGPFPSLTTLRFSHVLEPMGAGIAKAVHNFLMTKVPQLQDLSLELDQTQMAEVFSRHESKHYMIQLSKLRLYMNASATRSQHRIAVSGIDHHVFEKLLAYINSMATTLTELDVDGVYLRFEQFKNVVHLFKSPRTNVLRALHLAIYDLDPEPFVFTSYALPRLQRFTIRYRNFKLSSAQQLQLVYTIPWRNQAETKEASSFVRSFIQMILQTFNRSSSSCVFMLVIEIDL